ncbi:prolipoprotein diacylglyceryl transferase [Candidatus Synchoanobacter obligatus]|uniref:Phosphatidylglycerol--prolipoprotein diacylglyceryl transferase n=1 Tax=Candidatus Synchoanobacter obligatus TaxID=2919597 RepID=A0ABT1L5Z2_9GAMM|nr:prolipoprotein diacylglyceryl transferase [Candidatus Synchoanobacter obligatus]MCP8352604.1 prolipoprotein diacylglyceryl transferase [Candidatus Synchoanobacter obligatus]
MWIDPVAFHFFSWPIHWYGIAWAVSFLAILYCPPKRARDSIALTKYWHDIVSNALLASVIGGRLGEMLFYQYGLLLNQPWSMFMVWQGGMSFHGALILGGLTLWGMSKRYGINFWDITDASLIQLPLGLGIVRIANYINGELIGRVTEQTWGMSYVEGALHRHPSQLYEAVLEGLLLGILMHGYAKYHPPRGRLTILFMFGYASVRLLVECYFREPTYELFQWISTGQLLSVLMLLVGGLMATALRYQHHKRQTSQ